jgi:hypoxanthine phosphoribosyltransferase
MKYDPSLIQIRDRCRKLAQSIRQSKTVEPDSIIGIAEDLAEVADQLNSLLNQLDKVSRSETEGFRPFEGF